MDNNSDNGLWNPRTMILCPGSMKILGFLAPLEDVGILQNIDTYCGLSTGAIMALLMVVGYEIREIIGDFAKYDILRDTMELSIIEEAIHNKKFISSEPSRQGLTKLILNKLGVIPTLRGLYIATGKSFIATTFDFTTEQQVMMGPFTHPDVSCIDAAMYSMNIPFIFYQLIYRGNHMVDGIIANPYPIDYFDNGETDILGVYVKYKYQIYEERNINIPMVQNRQPPKIATHATKIIRLLLDQHRSRIIKTTSKRCRHVCLQIKTADNLSIDDHVTMLVEGFNEGKIFIDRVKDNTYINSASHNSEKYSYPPSNN